MESFRFEIGDTVTLKGSGRMGVVQERFTNHDTGNLYYCVRDQFCQPVVLVPELLVQTVQEAFEHKQSCEDLSSALSDAAYKKTTGRCSGKGSRHRLTQMCYRNPPGTNDAAHAATGGAALVFHARKDSLCG